ncbi:MAG: Glucan 1,4-alpha-maltohexaosidase [Phycisphaerales bacterium]|nr:Glucan 1,4-alpha-maltohexaosidase [Phycisphaerales bacterium]
MGRGVMFQYFEWNNKADGSLWRELAGRAAEIKALGTTAIWTPPAYKGFNGPNDTGYAVYDLYDLGEFDQKGGVRTKYGTKDEYLAAVKAVQAAGMDVYADVVLNHRMGGDETEDVEVQEVSNADRNKTQSDPYTIKAWSRYTFPGRGDAYSALKLNKDHFTAFGSNAAVKDDRGRIYKRTGKSFSGEVDFEYGNFDYLMGADVDHYHPEVRDELFKWGEWYVRTTGAAGFRLDAVKHIPASFFKDWLGHLRGAFPGKELFAVGEYWSSQVDDLQRYLAAVDGTMRLFDVPLHFRLQEASERGRDFDLRTVFDGTLVKENPLLAVTFVDNHDSQPGQALQSWVADWFKPLAYALLLLREHGYPCLFYGDYYGNPGDEHGNHKLTSHRKLIDDFLRVRRRATYGDLHDYFDHPQCVGWVWTGDAEHPDPSVTVMSTGDAGSKRINTHKPRMTFRDATGHWPEPVTTDDAGEAEFRCPPGSVSVWVPG